MPLHNKEISDVFEEVADLLEIQGANQFRVRAYRNAARTVTDLPQELHEMLDDGKDLTELSGIGRDLAAKIEEMVQTGSLEMLEKLHNDLPSGLRQVMNIPSVGPKRAQQLYKELDIKSVEDVLNAAEDGRVQQLDGFGKKTTEKIIRGIRRMEDDETQGRFRIADVERIADTLVGALKDLPSLEQVTVAGSYRRRKETVGDIDILVTCTEPETVMDRFVEYEEVERVISHGTTRSSVELRSGLQVDLRVIAEESYGAALHYFTGSKAHNVAIRKMAVDAGLKINEYGVFRSNDRIAGADEESVYDAVGMVYVEPELREDRGEIQAALDDNLPNLVQISDIRGDLQMHTNASDGKSTLEEMVQGAEGKGYEYIAITDHSKRVTMARGLDADRLREQIDAIHELNEHTDIDVLASSEVDILQDGSLDLPDDILEHLDIVVAAVHYNRNLDRETQTQRIIRALDNPRVDILAHPTGRLIGERGPYDINIDSVIEAAGRRGCFLEINADPQRLDLNDVYARRAKDTGVLVSIDTDAHSVHGLDAMKYGVAQARRGWLTKDDVLNTHSWDSIRKLLRKNNRG